MTTTPNDAETLARSRRTTLVALGRIDPQTIQSLTQLTLPEIQAIQEEVARVLPAGNLPAMLLSGLLKLKGRRLTAERVRQDLSTLFKGLELLPQGLYGIFIAGPAAVLYAYQKLLQLSGKRLEHAFPYGTWQFYVQFCLREDTARHANETVGFQQACRTMPEAPSSETALQTGDPAAAAAWICAAQELITTYDSLLAADWRERVMLRLLGEAQERAGREGARRDLIGAWNRLRPYHQPEEGDYLTYRRNLFQALMDERIAALSADAQADVRRAYAEQEREALHAYQDQMTILATLEPDRYQEHKVPIAPWRAAVAFVWQGRTYLLPVFDRDERGSPLCYPTAPGEGPFALYAGVARSQDATPATGGTGGLCDANGRTLTVTRDGAVWDAATARRIGTLRPTPPAQVKAWVGAILSAAPDDAPLPTLDLRLAEAPRSLQAQLREQLDATSQRALTALQRAPIVINWDLHGSALPLALIRRGRRGAGDHALTIVRGHESTIFDQSHIFFDGVWGMAVSEIVTDSAVHWYRETIALPSPTTMGAPPTAGAPTCLPLHTPPAVEAQTEPYRLRREAIAESTGVNMGRVHKLRRWLKQRGVRLTVNDLLLLYRTFHAARYRLSDQAQAAVARFRQEQGDTPEGREVLKTLDATLARFRETNPSLLIPMDAGNVSPRERLYPTTFRNPLTEMLALFDDAEQTHSRYLTRPGEAAWSDFDQARRELLAYLKAFGEMLDAIKAVTMRGESFNTATLKLLGHLPASMQYLLDQIPQRIGVLNEILKGNEVFSNVGRVAGGSTLRRFISAKDDGETKELVWGVMSDDAGTMHLSLRDFRPFVAPLIALGEAPVADQLAQDYLDSYVSGLNRFVAHLGTLVTAKVALDA
jgi:hypothetical protein